MKKFYFFTFILLLAGNLFAQPTPVQPSGDGLTPSTAYHVDNLANLYWITQHSESWGSYFIQTADIDASSTSGWNSGAGFSPIGNGTTNFTGSYNGQSHTISGLYINRSLTDYIGLFGGTSTAASVKNIGLLNVAITGGAYYVGGVVGWSAGDLDHCYTTGSVNGIECVGGVVGYVNSGNITNCSSTATVSGSNFAVGGLVGEKDGGNIDRCYSAGSVSAPNTVGGLVGYNEQTVSNSYSSGSVSGSVAGGLVGENSWGGTVSNCYSTGAVTGSSSIGGLVGLENSGTVSNSFWDVTTSGLGSDGSPNGSAGGTGENTGHMKDQSTFTTSPANWDFTTPIWAINSSINSGYPYLVGVTDHPLPVEATSFVAKADVESVTLTWQTQSEVDNAGFNILREDAGTNLFAPIASYTSNDALKGMGTSATGRKYSFTDTKVKSGLTYQYKIQSVSTNGATKDLTTLSVTVDIPKNYALYQNYPNPFNPNSTIRFDLKETSTVTLEVYNVLGQRVEYWNYGTMDAGRYNENVNLDALASGVYFYKLVASGVEPTAVGNDGQKFTATKKLVLMK